MNEQLNTKYRDILWREISVHVSQNVMTINYSISWHDIPEHPDPDLTYQDMTLQGITFQNIIWNTPLIDTKEGHSKLTVLFQIHASKSQ